jgi:hypothetical protein
MRRAEGSLTTGTYIAITQVDNKDLLSRARSNGVGHEIVGTRDKNDENVEVRTILTATCISHPSFSSGIVRALETTMYGLTTRNAEPPSNLQSTLRALSLTKRVHLIVFIMRETETKGEYQLVQNQSLSSYLG